MIKQDDPESPTPQRDEAPLDAIAREATTRARRFNKARQARATILIEDYVELISDLIVSHGEARVVDIAEHLGVSHASVVKNVARLKQQKLARGQAYRGIFLTESGEALAKLSRARHRMVVEVLLRLGVPSEDAEADAEGIEHHVSPTTLAAFARFLDRRKGV